MRLIFCGIVLMILASSTAHSQCKQLHKALRKQSLFFEHTNQYESDCITLAPGDSLDSLFTTVESHEYHMRMVAENGNYPYWEYWSVMEPLIEDGQVIMEGREIVSIRPGDVRRSTDSTTVFESINSETYRFKVWNRYDHPITFVYALVHSGNDEILRSDKRMYDRSLKVLKKDFRKFIDGQHVYFISPPQNMETRSYIRHPFHLSDTSREYTLTILGETYADLTVKIFDQNKGMDEQFLFEPNGDSRSYSFRISEPMHVMIDLYRPDSLPGVVSPHGKFMNYIRYALTTDAPIDPSLVAPLNDLQNQSGTSVNMVAVQRTRWKPLGSSYSYSPPFYGVDKLLEGYQPTKGFVRDMAFGNGMITHNWGIADEYFLLYDLLGYIELRENGKRSRDEFVFNESWTITQNGSLFKVLEGYNSIIGKDGQSGYEYVLDDYRSLPNDTLKEAYPIGYAEYSMFFHKDGSHDEFRNAYWEQLKDGLIIKSVTETSCADSMFLRDRLACAMDISLQGANVPFEQLIQYPRPDIRDGGTMEDGRVYYKIGSTTVYQGDIDLLLEGATDEYVYLKPEHMVGIRFYEIWYGDPVSGGLLKYSVATLPIFLPYGVKSHYPNLVVIHPPLNAN